MVINFSTGARQVNQFEILCMFVFVYAPGHNFQNWSNSVKSTLKNTFN